MGTGFLEELWDEAEDFFEDFIEVFTKRRHSFKTTKQAKIYGSLVAVRPAYLFAERLENFLRIVFGFSIAVSGVIASLWGFTRLSDVIDYLITSPLGRIAVVIIGLSYVVLGVWKIAHIKV